MLLPDTWHDASFGYLLVLIAHYRESSANVLLGSWSFSLIKNGSEGGIRTHGCTGLQPVALDHSATSLQRSAQMIGTGRKPVRNVLDILTGFGRVLAHQEF